MGQYGSKRKSGPMPPAMALSAPIARTALRALPRLPTPLTGVPERVDRSADRADAATEAYEKLVARWRAVQLLERCN